MQMIIVGDGPYRETLERDMKGKACTFLGRIPQDEKLSTIYASSDIFVSPSTTGI
jgi:glycosyltransferase involved in cell wall biosynthesis